MIAFDFRACDPVKARNWLWQKVEVKGLEQAMRHARFADFLDALGGANSRLLVSANPSGRRTTSRS